VASYNGSYNLVSTCWT